MIGAGPPGAAGRSASETIFSLSHSPYGLAEATSSFSSSSSMMRPSSRSTRNIFPGSSRPLATIDFGRDVERPDLGGHDHAVVVGHDVAAGSQAVAVEHGADRTAVGEGDRGRPVPRLHQAAMKPVEVALTWGIESLFSQASGISIIIGVRQAVARPHQQLDGVVEAGRVGEPLADDRLDLLQVSRLVEVGGEERLAGPHPVDVPRKVLISPL